MAGGETGEDLGDLLVMPVDVVLEAIQRFRVTLSDKGIPIKSSRAVWLFRAAYEMGVH